MSKTIEEFVTADGWTITETNYALDSAHMLAERNGERLLIMRMDRRDTPDQLRVEIVREIDGKPFACLTEFPVPSAYAAPESVIEQTAVAIGSVQENLDLIESEVAA